MNTTQHPKLLCAEINRKAVWSIIALDVGWVLLTGGLIVFGVFNQQGNALALVLAAVVAGLAWLQAVGLRRPESKS